MEQIKIRWKEGAALFVFLLLAKFYFFGLPEMADFWIFGVSDIIPVLVNNILPIPFLAGVFLYSLYKTEKRIKNGTFKFWQPIGFNIVMMFLASFLWKSGSSLISFTAIDGKSYGINVITEVLPILSLWIIPIMPVAFVFFFSFVPVLFFRAFYPNQKKFYVATVSLFLFLFLSLFVFQQIVDKTCFFGQNSFCLSDKAVKTNDLSWCEKTKYDFSKGLCYKETAIKKNDKELCEKISPQKIRESCFKKFDKETNLSGWKTYRNDEYGFEFKYPQDYENFSSSDVSLGYRLSGMYLDSGKIQYKEKIIANVSLMAKPTKENSAPLIVVHIFPLSSYGYTYLSGGVEFDYDAVNNKWSQVKVENGKVVTKQIEVEFFGEESRFAYELNSGRDIIGLSALYGPGYELNSDGDAGSGNDGIIAIPYKDKGIVLEFHFLADQNTITESKHSLRKIVSTFELTVLPINQRVVGNFAYPGTGEPGQPDAPKYTAYSTDGAHVYYQGKKIDADPQTIEVMEGFLGVPYKGSAMYKYARDRHNVFYEGKLLPKATPASFQPIENGEWDHFYGKDEKTVYFGFEPIIGADPKTFEILWQTIWEGCILGSYSKDSSRVYFGAVAVPGADPATFEALIKDTGKDIHGYYNGTTYIGKTINLESQNCDYGY